MLESQGEERYLSPVNPVAMMSRTQFWALNAACCLAVVLMFAHYALARQNNRLAGELNREHATISKARQQAAVLEPLIKRMVQSTDTEPRLATILARYGISLKAGAKPAAPQ